MKSAFGVVHKSDAKKAQQAARLSMSLSMKGKTKEAARAKKIWEKNVSKSFAYGGGTAMVRGMGEVGREAVGRARKGRKFRLKQLEQRGITARALDNAAKAKGSAGIDIQSRPAFGRKGKAAWDKGFHHGLGS